MTFKRRSASSSRVSAAIDHSLNNNTSLQYNDEVNMVVVEDNEATPRTSAVPPRPKGAMSATNHNYNCRTRPTLLLIVVILIALVFVTALTVFMLTQRYAGKSDDLLELIDQLRNSESDEQIPSEQWYWHRKAYNELYQRLVLHDSPDAARKKPRNVILFIGDGMGPNSVTAARIAGKGEESLLSWETFPSLGLLKTYCANKLVPDSFSTATALFGGTKTNYETGGVDAEVKLANCSASLDERRHVSTLAAWAQEAGMRTGFVTTTRVTHATPAALYAHSADRRWECESKMPSTAREEGCKDIARQLIEDSVGQNLNVIMGGGRQMLVSDVIGTEADPLDTWACQSHDGRNLMLDWKNQRKTLEQRAKVVENRLELADIGKSDDIDFLLGIFANGHLKYDHELDNNSMPSLEEMTVKAIEVLFKENKQQQGFFLMVEGGLIDQAHHRGTAKRAINEILALERAVMGAINTLNAANILKETLIVVTADHSHTLTINGYPERGGSIFGLAGNSRIEGIPYTILTYGTTYKGFQVDKETGQRRNPENDDLESWMYTQQGTVNTDENTHGGSDVTIHAIGPLSYLFGGVHEQSFVAHAIAYALGIGRFREADKHDEISFIQKLLTIWA